MNHASAYTKFKFIFILSIIVSNLNDYFNLIAEKYAKIY